MHLNWLNVLKREETKISNSLGIKLIINACFMFCILNNRISILHVNYGYSCVWLESANKAVFVNLAVRLTFSFYTRVHVYDTLHRSSNRSPGKDSQCVVSHLFLFVLSIFCAP